MKLSVLGLSHHSAPVEVREKVAFAHSESLDLLRRIRSDSPIEEVVLLSTCNRTELYLHPAGGGGLSEVRSLLSGRAGGLGAELNEYLYHLQGEPAVRHLFRVTAGLDALVIGEAEIQGQVREAYRLATGLQEGGVSGPVLHRLFQMALATGGRVRSETSLGRGTASVAFVAVQLARKIFGSLRGHRVLVVGAGETSELVVNALAREGVRGVVVANRTYDRATDLATRIQGRALRMNEVADALSEADLVVSSTAAPHPVITAATLTEAMPQGARRPILMIDLAIPRDIDPEVGAEPNVFLYNVDDLRQIVDDTLDQRRQAVPLAESIIAEMTGEFRRWYASQEAVPLIRTLREKSDRIRQHELERLFSRLDDLSEEHRSHLEHFSRRLINKLLHTPTARLRRIPEGESIEDLVEAARILYALDDDPGADPTPGKTGESTEDHDIS